MLERFDKTRYSLWSRVSNQSNQGQLNARTSNDLGQRHLIHRSRAVSRDIQPLSSYNLNYGFEDSQRIWMCETLDMPGQLQIAFAAFLGDKMLLS